MGLKFMERAQAKEKEALKSQVNLAVKQIKGEDDYAGSDDEGESSDEVNNSKKNIIDSSNKFGVKTLKPSNRVDARETGKEIDADKVLKAARRVTGNEASESSEEDEPMPVIKKQDAKKAKADKTAPTTVEFGDDDLQHFNADKDKLIKEDVLSGQVTEEAQLIKSLFVTQEEDAYEEFEHEKDA